MVAGRIEVPSIAYQSAETCKTVVFSILGVGRRGRVVFGRPKSRAWDVRVLDSTGPNGLMRLCFRRNAQGICPSRLVIF